MIGLLPAARGFLPHSTVPRVVLGPTQWVLMVLSMAAKWLVHETDLSPLWSTRVNVWFCISTPHVFFMVFKGTRFILHYFVRVMMPRD